MVWLEMRARAVRGGDTGTPHAGWVDNGWHRGGGSLNDDDRDGDSDGDGDDDDGGGGPDGSGGGGGGGDAAADECVCVGGGGHRMHRTLGYL